jgi:hypothetical protein
MGVLRVFKVSRFLKLARLVKFARILSKFQSMTTSPVLNNCVRLFKLVRKREKERERERERGSAVATILNNAGVRG